MISMSSIARSTAQRAFASQPTACALTQISTHMQSLTIQSRGMAAAAGSSTSSGASSNTAGTNRSSFGNYNNNSSNSNTTVSGGTPMDVDSVYRIARQQVADYRRSIDRDVDPKTGLPPATVRAYIRKVTADNYSDPIDHTNDDFELTEADAAAAVTKRKTLRGKLLHDDRVLSVLRQEEALQDQLSLLERYGQPQPLKQEYQQIIDAHGRSVGFGRRKSSRSTVYIKHNSSSDGQIVVNGRRYIEYFPRFSHRAKVIQPLEVTASLGNFDVNIKTWGGGQTGQADATKLAIARALVEFEPSHRPVLKEEFLLFRDGREVERKKVGRYKARKGHTFVKR